MYTPSPLPWKRRRDIQLIFWGTGRRRRRERKRGIMLRLRRRESKEPQLSSLQSQVKCPTVHRDNAIWHTTHTSSPALRSDGSKAKVGGRRCSYKAVSQHFTSAKPLPSPPLNAPLEADKSCNQRDNKGDDVYFLCLSPSPSSIPPFLRSFMSLAIRECSLLSAAEFVLFKDIKSLVNNGVWAACYVGRKM